MVIAHRLRASRPAPASRLMQSAICPATSRPRRRRERRLSLAPRLSVRSATCGSERSTDSAGASPKARPVHSESTAVTRTTPPSSDRSAESGRAVRATTRSVDKASQATSTPAAPPVSASRTLSVSNCRTRRPRPAPSARRSASSLRRDSVRASTAPVRLAQAMNNTSAALIMRTSSGVRMSPTIASRSGIDVMAKPLLASGCSRARSAPD